MSIDKERIKSLVKSLRNSRSWHRMLGLLIALVLLVSSVTGVLLAWKKNSDWIQPPTQKGASKNLSEWLPLDSLYQMGQKALVKAQPEQVENKIGRMDVRPSKGIVKVLFKEGNWEVQLDGKTGKTKSVAKRYSDWIESLHDGSIISDMFKFVSMNFLGFALVIMIITGTWIWYGQKVVRKQKRK